MEVVRQLLRIKYTLYNEFSIVLKMKDTIGIEPHFLNQNWNFSQIAEKRKKRANLNLSRFKTVAKRTKKLYLFCNNSVPTKTAKRFRFGGNVCLSYSLRHHKCRIKLRKTLDLYEQLIHTENTKKSTDDLFTSSRQYATGCHQQQF